MHGQAVSVRSVCSPSCSLSQSQPAGCGWGAPVRTCLLRALVPRGSIQIYDDAAMGRRVGATRLSVHSSGCQQHPEVGRQDVANVRWHQHQATCTGVQGVRSVAHRGLHQEVQREDTHACGQKAAPEDGGGIERSALLDREQQAADGGGERSRNACRATPWS